MNYSRIKELQRQTKVSNKELALKLKMSVPGFEKMLKLETCTVSTLEMIANHFNVQASYFFDEKVEKPEVIPYAENDKLNVGKETKVKIYSCPDCISKQKELDDKNRLIEALEKNIQLLEFCLGNKNRQSASG